MTENEITLIRLIRNNKVPEQAILTAIEEAQPRDIVAVIGKGCEKYRLDHNGYQDYNERTEVEKALNRRKRRELNEN
jgi:UDP-N-acetylmuramyl tripeptide synthase